MSSIHGQQTCLAYASKIMGWRVGPALVAQQTAYSLIKININVIVSITLVRMQLVVG
jgi:hypothetical protein